MRSTLKALGLLLGYGLCVSAQTAPATVTLQPLGAERKLPDRLFGSSISPFYEHLMSDPAKVAMLKSMHVALTRFPGGSDANYYQPKSGQLVVQAGPNASWYKKFWATVAPRIDAGYPNGISAEEFKAFDDQIGAEMILVPNIDSSTVDDQRAWFARMARDGVLSHYVEMGNEMYLAMMNDPDTLRKFPDEPRTLAIEKQYADAIRPSFLPGTKVAVQAAPEGFSTTRGSQEPGQRKFDDWNKALQPQDWYQAVTLHLYAPLTSVLGRNPSTDPLRVYRGLMGRFDEGLDWTIETVSRRVPGKEIWVTEFNPRGGRPGSPGDPEPVTPALQMQVTARALLSLLRHPQVTVAQYFMLNFDPRNVFSVFVKSGDSYQPLPVAQAVSWFFNAANGGATYRGFASGNKIPGGGAVPDAFFAVEAGLFVGPQGRTLLVQNATEQVASLDLAPFGEGPPSHVDTLATPNLGAAEKLPANPVQIPPAGKITLPPFSLTRVLWAR